MRERSVVAISDGLSRAEKRLYRAFRRMGGRTADNAGHADSSALRGLKKHRRVRHVHRNTVIPANAGIQAIHQVVFRRANHPKGQLRYIFVILN
jgi:hypothetical protein